MCAAQASFKSSYAGVFDHGGLARVEARGAARRKGEEAGGGGAAAFGLLSYLLVFFFVFLSILQGLLGCSLRRVVE